MRRISFAIALFICAGCDSPTAPTTLAAAFQSSMTLGGSLPAFSASVSGTTLSVVGGIELGHPCVDFAVTAGTSGKTLTATLRATAKPNVGCVAVVGRFSYTIEIPNVPRGKWTLNVVHDEYPGSASSRMSTPFTTTVEVR
jgi:hypothetical protein